MHEVIVPIFGLPVHTAIMLYIGAGLIVFSVLFSRRLCVVPGKLQSIVELVFEVFISLAEEVMGHSGKRFIPFILTFFIFIFISNALGLVPGFIPPTANINTTLGLALIVFISTHILGIKKHGIGYLKHFLGPVWWLAPVMMLIELIGHLARPVSLSLRLFGNMMGHEKIVAVFLILMPLSYPLLAIATLLGLFVAIVQAFIFSLLTMAYIGGALEEGH